MEGKEFKTAEIFYGINSHNHGEFLLAPGSFLLYGELLEGQKYRHISDPNTISNITLALKEGKISKERLESKGWIIEPLYIPERYIKDYNWNTETIPKQSLERIIEIVYSHIKSIRFTLTDEREQYNNIDYNDDNEEIGFDEYDDLSD